MSSPALRVRAAVLAFLAFNATVGMIFGAFGTLLQSLATEYSASRATVASALSLCMMVFGLSAPIVGMVLQRASLRLIMTAGAAINALAFGLLAMAGSIGQVLALYALVGVGTGMLGIVAPTALVSRWFESSRGRVLGLVTAPVFMLATPLAMAKLLPVGGLPLAFAAQAGVFVLLTPLMLLVIDRPSESAGAAGGKSTAALQTPGVFNQPRFWLLTLGVGLVTGAGTAFVVHTVSFFMEKGLSLNEAASAYSAYAVAGLGGTLLFGWLADRIGPVTALMLNVGVQTLLWAALVPVTSTVGLVLLAGMIGLCLPATNALHGAALAALFGVGNVPRVLGVSYFLKIPFLLVMAPLAGHVYDVTGSYAVAYLFLSGMLLLAALAFLAVRIRGEGLRAPMAEPAVG